MGFGCCPGCGTICGQRWGVNASSPWSNCDDIILPNTPKIIWPALDSGYSYSEAESANIASNVANILTTPGGSGYFEHTFRWTRSAQYSGVTETRWDQRYTKISSVDGRVIEYTTSTSELGETYSWELSETGEITESDDDWESPFAGADDYGTKTTDSASHSVTATTGQWRHDFTGSLITGPFFDQVDVTLGTGVSRSAANAAAIAKLSVVDLSTMGGSYMTPIAGWSTGPMLDSNTTYKSLQEILSGSFPNGNTHLLVGSVRHESEGLVSIVFKQGTGTTSLAGFGPGTAAGSNFHIALGLNGTGDYADSVPFAGRAVSALKSLIIRRTGIPHLAHYAVTDDCDNSVASTATECNFASQGVWHEVTPSDCTLDYCSIARDSSDTVCNGYPLVTCP